MRQCGGESANANDGLNNVPMNKVPGQRAYEQSARSDFGPSPRPVSIHCTCGRSGKRITQFPNAGMTVRFLRTSRAHDGSERQPPFYSPPRDFRILRARGSLTSVCRGHGFHDAGARIDPQRMGRTLSFEIASRVSEPAPQIAPFHPRVTTVWIASSGKPRRMSSTRSSKTSWIASLRLILASSTVAP